MKSNSEINPKYLSVKTWIEALPQHFEAEGMTIYADRNQLKTFEVEGVGKMVVKRFKRLGWLKGIIYTYFRPGKAIRSYNNALQLLKRGVDTPEPVAFVDVMRHGLLSDSYYICRYTNYMEIGDNLHHIEPLDVNLARAYGVFVAELHDKGILHYDLNSGNVLYKLEEDGRYLFQLIDLNRMRFMPEGREVPKSECMENLTLFTRMLNLHAIVVRRYAEVRGLDVETFVAQAKQIKARHDRHRLIKKKVLHPVRTIKALLNHS